MNSIMKKAIFIIAFILVALVLPLAIMLFFVDTESRFSTYVIVYGIILFAIFGYLIVSVRTMEKTLEDALEEIKMQNAAIAYKISSTETQETEKVVETKVEDTNMKISLNPADPLIIPEANKVVKTEKVTEDDFDDFK